MGDAARALDALLGEWDVVAELPTAGSVRGIARLGPLFDGRLVELASTMTDPVPNSRTVIVPGTATTEFTCHYFDARAVVRLYAMTFDGRIWTMQRESADFSPLGFGQRFVGELSDDRAVIEARWEQSDPPGSPYRLDFPLTYRRR